MARKSNPAVRSVADEPVIMAEARPAPATVAIAPATLAPVNPTAEPLLTETAEGMHPALDRGPVVTSTDTQNALEMNTPADQVGVPYSGEALGVTPAADVPSAAVRTFTGTGLLTIAQEAERRAQAAGAEPVEDS